MNGPVRKTPQHSLPAPPNSAKALLPISLGTNNGPQKKQKQCPCRNLGGQAKSTMAFSKVAHTINVIIKHVNVINECRF